MRKSFIAKADSILEKWTICGSRFSVSDFDFTDSWFLYNVNTLEWIMKFSHDEHYNCYNPDGTAPKILPAEISNRTSEFLRAYMVIPSYLMFYRLIVLFGRISNEFSLHRDLWEFSLIHNESGTKMRIHDFRAGFRISFFKHQTFNQVFRNDLLEILNFLTLPFWLKPIIPPIYFKDFQFRLRIMKSNKLFFSLLSKMIKRTDVKHYRFVKINLRGDILKYFEIMEENDTFFESQKSPYLTTADFYCSANNYRMDDEQSMRFKV